MLIEQARHAQTGDRVFWSKSKAYAALGKPDGTFELSRVRGWKLLGVFESEQAMMEFYSELC